MSRRTICSMAFLLALSTSVTAGTVSVEVTLSVLPNSLEPMTRAYVEYTNIFGNKTAETVDVHHTLIEDCCVIAVKSMRTTTPWSSTLTGTTAVQAGSCYGASAGASADDSAATRNAPQMCFYGPPPPTVEDKCDGESGYGQPCSPLIINLTQGPWTLSGAADPVLFDIDADGTLDKITWTQRGSGLGFLAWDRNANGRIDNGAELFGTATPLSSGTTALNGFDALREFDDNNDEVVDIQDARWPQLVLWVDVNHDGISDPGEINPITESDLLALHVNYSEISKRDRYANAFRYMSHVELSGGRRPYYDVYFRAIK
jgi:hypothetical protein